MRGGWFGSMVTTAAMALVALGSTNDAAAMGTPLPVECNPTMEETGAPQAYAEQPGYKLDLHRVQQDTVLQSFELYTGFVGGGSAWFVVYEGASTGGSFSLVWSDQVTLGEAGWYASGPVDLDMAANHDYAVGLVATPGVLVYRSGNGTGLGGAWGSTIAGAVVASQTVTDPVTLTTGMHLYTQRLHLAEWCQQVSIYDNDIDNDGVDRPADCDDWDATVYPGAPELCDGKDNDCNGHPDDDEHDGDGDGWASCAGDCDDTDPSLHLHDLDGDGICDPAAQTTVLYAEDWLAAGEAS